MRETEGSRIVASFITPDLFRFLKTLARNNNREWFEKHKQSYIDDVRDPLCAFVEVIGPKLSIRFMIGHHRRRCPLLVPGAIIAIRFPSNQCIIARPQWVQSEDKGIAVSVE